MLRWTTLLLVAGCSYDVSLEECSVRCGAGRQCPAAYLCNAGGYCVTNASVSCNVADADPAAPDADPTAPDADPTAPDAAPGAPDAPPPGTPDAPPGPSCGDECGPSGARGGCVSSTDYQICGNYDGDGCLEWGTASCGGGEQCSGDTCFTPCSDECAGGARECVGDPATSLQWRECGQFDGDACLEWSGPMMCAPPMGCSGGICIT